MIGHRRSHAEEMPQFHVIKGNKQHVSFCNLQLGLIRVYQERTTTLNSCTEQGKSFDQFHAKTLQLTTLNVPHSSDIKQKKHSPSTTWIKGRHPLLLPGEMVEGAELGSVLVEHLSHLLGDGCGTRE